jgi:hypothetical protein
VVWVAAFWRDALLAPSAGCRKVEVRYYVSWNRTNIPDHLVSVQMDTVPVFLVSECDNEMEGAGFGME